MNVRKAIKSLEERMLLEEKKNKESITKKIDLFVKEARKWIKQEIKEEIERQKK